MKTKLDHTSHPFVSRYFETENDLKHMQDMLIEARSRTDDWHYAHVGELMWVFFMVDCHLNTQEHIRLWHDDDKLVGYAILSEDPNVDFQVLPEYEWCGIEEETMAWVETRLLELRKHNTQRWGGHLVSGARKDNAKRNTFLKQHGFQPGGQFSEVNMFYSLGNTILEAVIPHGYQVRAVAEADEISNRASAQREVWHPWTVGNVNDDDYSRFMQLPAYHRDLDVVAIAPDGVIAAYANCWIDPINLIGDFGPVGTRPPYRRKGLARAVLIEGLRRMQSFGMNRVSVSTGVSNTPARRLYESAGFRIVNEFIEYIKTK
jgi:mycothiol synthase